VYSIWYLVFISFRSLCHNQENESFFILKQDKVHP